MNDRRVQLALVAICCGATLWIVSVGARTEAPALTRSVSADSSPPRARVLASPALDSRPDRRAEPAARAREGASARPEADWMARHHRELERQGSTPAAPDATPLAAAELLVRLRGLADGGGLASSAAEELLARLGAQVAERPAALAELAARLSRRDLPPALRARLLEVLGRAGSPAAQELLLAHVTRAGLPAERLLAVTAAALVERPGAALFDALLGQARAGEPQALFSLAALGSRVDAARAARALALIEQLRRSPRHRRAALAALAMLR